MQPKLLLLTFVGGAVGSAARFLIGQVSNSESLTLWIVNLLGALMLGYVHTSKFTSPVSLQALLGTGLAGGFTTVSGLITFSLLAPGGSFLLASLQVATGILIYWLGRVIGGERSWLKS